MPMYGQSFSLADNNKNGLNSPTYGGGEAGEATRARGFLSYYEICTNIKNKGWQVSQNFNIFKLQNDQIIFNNIIHISFNMAITSSFTVMGFIFTCFFFFNQVIRDPKGRMGPYAYLRDQWVSFDDQSMIQHKSEYIRAMGLGGGMIWALDLDDFKNICNCEQYPLLRTINRVLRGRISMLRLSLFNRDNFYNYPV